MIKERYFIAFYTSSKKHFGLESVITEEGDYINIPLTVEQIKKKHGFECELTLINIIELSYKDHKVAFEKIFEQNDK